jgi:hypothetical protein
MPERTGPVRKLLKWLNARPSGASRRVEPLARFSLNMPGWRDDGTRGDMRGWRDEQGDVLTLVVTHRAPDLSSSPEIERQGFARRVAESRKAGLIEVCLSGGALGPTSRLIYKRLEKPAYAFTGMLFAPAVDPPQVWTIAAREHGTTGLREAIITTELFNAGRMTLEAYERSWASDPYDAGYRGVDRSVLRFVSDDESYDERFPQHPLSKVRRILKAQPDSVAVGGS